MNQECLVCSGKVHGAYLDAGCSARLYEMLRRCPSLLAQLALTATGQSQMASNVGSPSATTPLPFSEPARKAQLVLEGVLIGHGRGLLVIDRDEVVTGTEAARLLAAASKQLRTSKGVENLYFALERAVLTGWRLVDRPGPVAYLGPCYKTLPQGGRCELAVMAREDEIQVKCKCGGVHDRAQREAWVLQATRSTWLIASDMAEHLRTLGADSPTVEKIEDWAKRKRIRERTRTVEGMTLPIYLVGEVWDLWDVEQKRAARRAEKRKRTRSKGAETASDAA